MCDNVKKDIYLKLMEDLLGTTISPNSSIFDTDINGKMIASCNNFSQVLGVKGKKNEMIQVGINGKQFLEPCPIAYTGKIEKNNTFDTVFVGLNPFSEGPRVFPSKAADGTDDETDWADLANMHHPNDVWYKRSINRYAVSKKNIDAGIMRNNYWRVFGNKEGKRLSPYYRLLFQIHVFLHWERIKDEFKKLQIESFETWSDFRKGCEKANKSFTNEALDILRKYPIANIEAIPYKSEEFKTQNYRKLFSDSKTARQYEQYLKDTLQFIDDYAKQDSYIIITSKAPDIDIVSDVFISMMSEISGNPVTSVVKGGFSRKQPSFHKNANKKAKEMAPLYLFKWGNHKVVVSTPISQNDWGFYSWQYASIPKDFVKAISKDENYHQ